MKTLTLQRFKSGPTEVTLPLGDVAEAVVFTDGLAVLRWLTEPYGIEIYPTETDMRMVRERSGRSQFIESS
jgi:hypothetical protein